MRPAGDRRGGGLRHPYGCSSYHRFAVRLPWGRHKDAVRPPYDVLGTQDRVKTECHLTAITRPPYGDLVMWLRHCGFWKSLISSLKKPQGLRLPCGELNTIRSPYGLHKKLRPPYGLGDLGRRTVAANTPQGICDHGITQYQMRPPSLLFRRCPHILFLLNIRALHFIVIHRLSFCQ